MVGPANRPLYKPPAIVSDGRATSLIGFLRAMVSNPVCAVPASAYEDGLTVLSLPGARVGYVCDPVLLEDMLIKRPEDFPKSAVDERIFKPAFGSSLLIAQGDDWRWKRRLAAPYFARANLTRLVPKLIAPFETLVCSWSAMQAPTVVDVSAAMTKATAEAVSTALFSNQEEIDISALAGAIRDYLTPISWTIGLATLKVPAWVPHPGKHRIRSGQQKMRLLVGDLIAARRRSSVGRQDICADMMNAKDPDSGRPLSDPDLVDMLLTLVAAGHETSANALTWVLFCLAEQPELQDELRSEVHSVAGTRAIGSDDIPALVKVEAVVKETMRLFPPAPLLARRTIKAESLQGQDFSAGSTLFIPIYAIHRHKRLWPSPDRFDAYRFLAPDAKRIQRTVYMPFGAGLRVCIGGTFAMTEMIGATATLIRGLQFATSSATSCEPIHRVTLRPRDDLLLDVKPA